MRRIPAPPEFDERFRGGPARFPGFPWTRPNHLIKHWFGVETCDVCNEPAENRTRWNRVAPPEGTLETCDECSARFLRQASDRADEADEMYRVLGVALRLGGEVWRSGDRTLWFQDAVHPASTSMLSPPPMPPAHTDSAFLYGLAAGRLHSRSAVSMETRAAGESAGPSATRNRVAERRTPQKA